MVKCYLMTYKENNTIMVSHGVREDNLRNICLSLDTLDYYVRICGAKQYIGLGGEYYIEVNDD